MRTRKVTGRKIAECRKLFKSNTRLRDVVSLSGLSKATVNIIRRSGFTLGNYKVFVGLLKERGWVRACRSMKRRLSVRG